MINVDEINLQSNNNNILGNNINIIGNNNNFIGNNNNILGIPNNFNNLQNNTNFAFNNFGNILNNLNPDNKNIIIEKPNEEKKDVQNINIINVQENEGNIPNDDLKKAQIRESKDDQKYLANLDEEKELQNLINQQLQNNEDDDDSDDEETFPFRVIGDVQKKGEIFGLFNSRYLEVDCIKQVIKRYTSSKEYPRNPLETIPIASLKTLKKKKKLPNQEYYEFELSHVPQNAKNNKEKLQTYRVRHVECRTKWFDTLLALWKHIVKKEPLAPINKNKLIFINDQIGIIQEIKQNKTVGNNDNCSNVVSLRNFKILSVLGTGAFGTVFKVQHILSEKIYAMKVMNKNYIIQKKYLHYVVSEFEIMKLLSGFPFVLDLHYCFQSANYLYMIVDICPNGDFEDLKYINNIKLFFAELVLAFEHIHNHNVVYRDLKPENILLDAEGHIKVCDFNLAKGGITRQKRALSFCGSPMYISPEMLDPKGVDQRADIYGIGLLMYELITGHPAYNAPNINVLYEKIKANKINFNEPQIKGDIKDLLQKILVKDPDERISLEDIKKHPYFKDISFLKVFKKEYGPIITKKKDAHEINQNNPQKIFSKNIISGKDGEQIKDEKETQEKKNQEKFKEQQKELDDNKSYTILDGKISVREMKKDQKRAMKNYVREFYYVKKEDSSQTEEFTMTVNSYINTNGL